MKLRSLLLVSCMLVVPALAMFSHWIPMEFRAATRRSFVTAFRGLMGSRVEAGTVSPPPTTTPFMPGQLATPDYRAETAGLSPADTASPRAATGLAPVATGLPPAAAGAPGTTASLLPVGATAAVADEPAAPPLVAQLADRTRQVRDQQVRDQQEIEAQLNAVGAVSFDCQPLPGSNGLYSSSCRMPVDATGQLQRVFQASGHDPGSASAALLEQVMAWRKRLTSQPPAAAPGRTDGTGSLPSGSLR